MSPEEVLEQLLEARGYKTKLDRERFLNPDYDNDTHDPFLLDGMKEAVNRIIAAKKSKERVFIYGDYDVDGLTATTVLTDALAQMGIETGHYLPNRFTEGYGLSKKGMDAIKKAGGRLVVTVDCGSLSFAEADYAKKIGLDLIITDHHSINPELPDAIAVINPKRQNSKYPFRDLAGVGVAFKLVQALQQKLGEPKPGQEKWLLDLVALGTICDIVSLNNENRVLVKWGLEVMKRTKRPGLKALAAVSGVELPEVDEFDVGFRFGPRLNAAGRMDTAQDSLDLLLAEEEPEAMRLALKLNGANQQRQSDQEQIFKEAMLQAEEQKNEKVLMLYSPNWSHGIVGIVASKVMEKHRKPTLILQVMGDKAKGSGRSFGNYHLDQAIGGVREHLISGGGHAFAAGLTLETDKIPLVKEKLNKAADNVEYEAGLEHFTKQADVYFKEDMALDVELASQLDKLRPYGQSNRQPVIEISKFEVVDSRSVGKDGSHLKLKIKFGGQNIDCIGFNMAGAESKISSDSKMKGCFELNRFNGRVLPQIRVIEIA